MRLLVDGRPLSAASATRGIGTYVRTIVTRLADEPDITVVALATPDTELPAGVERIDISRYAPNRLNFAEQALLMPRGIRRAHADVFHSPGTDPPRKPVIPYVQTLHDVIPLTFPDPKFKYERFYWRFRARWIRHAAAVITDSNFSADEAVHRLGVKRERIHVVPLGVSPSFQPAAERSEPDPPYLLYVSEYGPHKGFVEAFAVIARLADAGLPHRLKMVGHMSAKGEAFLRRLTAASGHPERIDLLGRVSSDELHALYQHAGAVIVTSRSEGFCFPALEGMASGSPVVAFDNTAIPEVVGDAGVLVPDGDVVAFADAVQRLVTSPTAGAELVAAGLEQAKRFRWATCASRHIEIFRAVAQLSG